jgi:hypothetical protein
MFGPGVVSAVLLGACGAGGILAACSSSGGGFTGVNDGGKTSTADSSIPVGDGGACTPSSALQIHFAPMYSAFVTDSTSQSFQVPAIVQGGTGSATWSASDPSAVSFAPDTATGGTMMTVSSATPSVTITAQVGALCTSTTLNITSAVEADWQAGNARYNNGVPVYAGCIDQKVLPILEDSGIHLPGPPDAGCPDAGPACTGCHGANPTGGFFTGVEHTPEQTAGFSDEQLVNIFVNGTVEDGGAFNPQILPYEYWHLFHTWSDISTPEGQKGMVVYLRSLTPVSEQGGLNFGELEDAGILGGD